MELDIVADMEVDKVPDKVADMVADMVAKKKITLTSTRGIEWKLSNRLKVFAFHRASMSYSPKDKIMLEIRMHFNRANNTRWGHEKYIIF